MEAIGIPLLALLIILALAVVTVIFGGGSPIVQKVAQVGGIAYILVALLTIFRFLLKS